MQQFCRLVVVLLVLASTGVQAGRLSPLPANRSLDVLKGKVGGNRNRRLFWQAGRKLGDWTIHIADVRLDGPFLQMLAKKDRQDPFSRIVREATGLPLDVDDFVYFLDDVLRAKRKGLRAKSVWLNPVKARKTGVLLDTGDVFEPIHKRLYGRFSFEVYTARNHVDQASQPLSEEPQVEDSQAEDSQAEDSQAEDSQAEDSQAEDSQAEDSQAEDSQAENSQAENSQAEDSQADSLSVVPPIESLSRKERLLGPHWTQYYTDPTSEEKMLEALQKAQRSPDFVDRIRMLLKQLREQGAVVGVHSTVRDNRRGYLMWGAYLLSRSHTKDSVKRAARRLRVLNRKWDLNIPIRWYHPAGWRETNRLARQMVNEFDVAFATPHGAHRSKHYNGEAIRLDCDSLTSKPQTGSARLSRTLL